MKIHNTFTPATPVALRAARQPDPKPLDQVTFGSPVRTAAVAAGIGAVVGAGTSLLYASLDRGTATSIHMGLILAGGLAGAFTLNGALEPRVGDPGIARALGGLAGAGFVWGTSGFGILGAMPTGTVAGALIGATYGGMGAAILG
ncbi:MAG: hypothetical protein KC910_05270 [Candidatus Eremiobacteraeota bacterium]|nr:hypothetical protein [Candidatus Eremiobacteraeota bacterium]